MYENPRRFAAPGSGVKLIFVVGGSAKFGYVGLFV
jgi:hypothetical protein